MHILLLVLLAVLALLVIGGLRPVLGRAIWAAFGIPATTFRMLTGVLRSAERWTVGALAAIRGGLAYRPDGVPPDSYDAWDILAPLVYAASASVIITGDLVLASLRFGALLGIPTTELPLGGTSLDLMTGVLFVAVIGTMGAVWLDLAHVTPMRRPFGQATGRTATLLRAVTLSGTVLAVISGVLFFVWGQGALAGSPDDDLATLFVALFAALLVIASILALAGCLGLPLVLVLAVSAVLLAVLVVVRWTVRLLSGLTDAVHGLTQALLLVVAWPGESAWNWLAGFPFATSINISPVPPALSWPRLGSDGGGFEHSSLRMSSPGQRLRAAGVTAHEPGETPASGVAG